MTDVPAEKKHSFDLLTNYCVGCGQAKKAVAEGRWPEHCPGMGETNLVAISHLVRARRLLTFARKAFQEAYCGA